MNVKVFYHSTTGNTEKLARVIADVMQVEAEKIEKHNSDSFSEPVDLLFIGDGVYFGKPNKKTSSFIATLDPKVVKNVAVFASYGGQKTIGNDISKLLQAKGIRVISEPFICKGQSWLVLNRNHPNSGELNKAQEYASNIYSKVNKTV